MNDCNPTAKPEEIPYIDEGNDQMEEKEQSSKATFDEDLDTSEEMQIHIIEVEALESEKLQDFADGIEEREADVESPVTEEIVEPIEAIIDEVEIESDNIETGSEESTTPEIIDTKQSKSNACKFFLVAILFAILALIITFCSLHHHQSHSPAINQAMSRFLRNYIPAVAHSSNYCRSEIQLWKNSLT